MMLLNPKGNVNLHTHTCYCDGKDTPLEMVQKAMELGFCALGFSGHGFSVYDEEFCMSQDAVLRYREEILQLKAKYAGQIAIYLGVEQDLLGEKDDFPYDYVIGSAHYALAPDGTPVCVDKSEADMVYGVKTYFGGDYSAYVESYFAQVAQIAEKTDCHIVGHFDLVTKFNEGCKYFDETADWYRNAARSALLKLADREKKPILEINTGAMARGYRSVPYPAAFILQEAVQLGFPMLLSSDCHDLAQLDYGFAKVLEKIRNCVDNVNWVW